MDKRLKRPPTTVEYPPLAKEAVSFAKETAKYVGAGCPNRTDELIAKLREICVECEWYVPVTKIGPRCQLCGCCTNIKTTWETAFCPIDRWDDILKGETNEKKNDVD